MSGKLKPFLRISHIFEIHGNCVVSQPPVASGGSVNFGDTS